MRVIIAGNGESASVDLDEILDRVRYETTKASLQFSIRALIAHKLIEKKGIEKRRGRQRQVIEATELGAATYNAPKPAPAASYVSSVEDDEWDTVIENLT
ncbi:hypothetical protein QN372_00415 [Undibacterium sp. RTI2.1]|uniref:hypothetical protein n=1 Tax=unclassified Undibacterium TaxID=2630295 RepID=UPI002B234F11|nr:MULTISPECIES: hypothetical protein [unclassified Undibacterium]MEB0029202.1 hypothetical protein [Undibacterium sp. RTI2.1]MEB0115510.1 hypothetical protein [Undibacterium sp. RTI2.2]MEB0230146.1 hypothetical protein [Undibacterium sp. 10I3]MEB0256338.1 hypothetical protein [Undibacterium sp. 5I1]